MNVDETITRDRSIRNQFNEKVIWINYLSETNYRYCPPSDYRIMKNEDDKME